MPAIRSSEVFFLGWQSWLDQNRGGAIIRVPFWQGSVAWLELRPVASPAMVQRIVETVPHDHWKTTNFLAASRVTGLTAPSVVDGAINGEPFLGYVRQQLAPTLRLATSW